MTAPAIPANPLCPIQGAASSRLEWEGKNLNPPDSTGNGKTQRKQQKVSGHDLSRANKANQICWALAPEGCLSEDSLPAPVVFRNILQRVPQ